MVIHICPRPVAQAGLETPGDLLRQHVEVGFLSTDTAVQEVLDSDLAALRGLHKECDMLACLRQLQRRRRDYGLLISSALMEYLLPHYFLASAHHPPAPCPMRSHLHGFLRSCESRIRQFVNRTPP